MKKRALILTAVLTAAALTGGSGYLPVTDGIRSKMIQNVYADAEDSKESADTETSDSVLDQATIMYQQYNYDEAIKLLKKQDDFTKNKDYMDLAAKCQIAKKSLVEYPLEKITHVFFHTLIEDTSRAFDGDSKSGNYNQVMTTVSEFNKIIQIMYDKGYDRGQPLEFVCGAGQMIKGFDAAVADMKVGEIKEIHLMPEEAYGQPNPDAIFTLEIEQLPGAEDLTVGQQVYLSNQYGQPFPVKVTAKDEKTITFDANHEMAGKELNFKIELVEVK